MEDPSSLGCIAITHCKNCLVAVSSAFRHINSRNGEINVIPGHHTEGKAPKTNPILVCVDTTNNENGRREENSQLQCWVFCAKPNALFNISKLPFPFSMIAFAIGIFIGYI